ncbi:hypothetical protein TVAG_463890 [Trichomonas vaginalis G3]|uniref:CUE domain-containing protein n=1 Tax=Trichomonas vaginalis (strain ATCC PRA-98 / G3) TaxID=412133 RepID=A2E241_TRIV3|nr:CUE domain containing protein 1 family [Trichomonas vaginalis G3]EAY13255.1 hypothetical protein TVAG_463890 [Trichomonas vaginalis G3]KAI5494086.1 CUE domain containing protein 1 family [Trichomonas vaginalis G3]|eukprot:XP_001325478.1 hypothetical protein [Trichomonas vaginalis G3]
MSASASKVNSIAEIFPNHRRDTIEALLKELDGDVDATIAILLDTPENTPPPPESSKPPSHASAKSSSTTSTHHHHTGSHTAAKPAQSHHSSRKQSHVPKLDHIFDDDFLRWPDDAEVVRVSHDGRTSPYPDDITSTVDLPVSTDSVSNADSTALGADTAYQTSGTIPVYPKSGSQYAEQEDYLLPSIGVDANLIPGVDADSKQTASWWDNFKARFSKKKGNHYQSLN